MADILLSSFEKMRPSVFILLIISTFLLLVAGYDETAAEHHQKFKVKARHLHSRILLHQRHKESSKTRSNSKSDEKQGQGSNIVTADHAYGVDGFENPSAQAALIIDFRKAELVYLLNGENGIGITFNVKTGQSTQNQNVWHSQQNFSQLAQNCRSHLLQNGQPADENELNEILKKLVLSKEDVINSNKVTIKLRDEGMRFKDNPQTEKTKLTALDILHRTEGIEELGVVKIVKQLDLKVLAAPNGLEALLAILKDVDVKAPKLKDLSDILNDPEKFFDALAKLSDTNDPIDNLVKVIRKLVGVLRGKVQLGVFIRFLITEGASGNLMVNPAEAKSVLSSLIEVAQTLNQHTPLSGFLQTLQQILNQNFVLDGLNLSETLKFVGERNSGGIIFNIVHILLGIASKINPVHSVPVLVENIIIIINSSGGLNAIQQIVPNLDTSSIKGGDSNPLVEIVKNLNIIHIVEHSPLMQIPVLGQILQAICKAIETFAGPEAIIRGLQTGTLIRHIPIIGQIFGVIGSMPGPNIVEGVVSNVEKGIYGALLGNGSEEIATSTTTEAGPG